MSMGGNQMSLDLVSQHLSKRHFLGLDGLRGVAALVVVFLHGAMTFDIGYVPGAACLAVDFFFLLSGFVIAFAYDAKLGRGGMTWRRFMAVRTIRLYPMLFLGTALGALLFVLAQIHRQEFHFFVSSIVIAGSFALLPVGLAVGLLAYPLNVPVWSLFFEFVANALYGTRFGKLGLRSLAVFIGGSGAALVAMAVWGGPFLYIGFGTPTKFLLGFVRVTYPFWAGVFLFRAARLRRVPRVPISVIGFVLASLLLVPFAGPAYSLPLVLVAFPALVALGASASLGNLTARVCSAAGRVSYPLYLIHWPVYRAAYRASEVMHLAKYPWAMLIGGAVVSVALAEALLVAFDEPTRTWLTGRLRLRQSRMGGATGSAGRGASTGSRRPWQVGR